MKHIYDKLIRDKIPEIILSTNKKPIIHIEKGINLKNRLFEKLIEELEEFKENPCKEEMADMLEVIYALGEIYNFSESEVEKIRIKKNNSRGGFKKGIILESVEDWKY